MNLFGKKKEQPKPTIPQPNASTSNAVDTIRTLRDHAETLEKRESHITKKVEAALTEAKQKAAKKDKKGKFCMNCDVGSLSLSFSPLIVGALFALKRKKMFESEIMKLQGARITLDSQINALESAAVNIETLKAMNAGAKAMKQVRGNM
jgi:charged multivesicular body protein 4